MEESGPFAEYGSLIHTLLEKYLKGELLSFELSDNFENLYMQKVTDRFPPCGKVRLYDKYYEQGLAYFQNTDSLECITDQYEILGVEHKHNFKIEQYDFTGILDVEARHKENGFEIIDHKTKSGNGKSRVLTRLTKKHNPTEWLKLDDGRYINRSMFRQQYIYCKPFKETYGEFPSYLNLNMARIGDWYKLKFNQDDYNESLQWAIHTIADIYATKEWKPIENIDDFFCNYLCDTSAYCKYTGRYVED